MREILVTYDEGIEDWIRSVMEQFKGLAKITLPPYSYCKSCPVQVKAKCDYFRMRNERELV
jgi:hypothetical protein